MKRINWKIVLAVFLVVLLASVLRVYKLDTVPPSLSWDEAAVGYNAWSIANYGKDEWGKTFPPYFTSFLDDKHPIHIYATAIFVKFLGLTEFSTRLPAAVFGVFNVVLMFFLGRLLFKSNLAGLIGAVVLAISPYNLQFSRFNHELNFAIFFFMLGLTLFLQGLKSKNFLLALSFLSFGIDLLTYHSAKVVVPPVVLLLVVLYRQDLLALKKQFLTGLAFLTIFIGIIAINPALLGVARAEQTTISSDQIIKTDLYKQTQNQLLGWAEIVWKNYQTHFTQQYLFISGDSNSRHSTQAVGEFYWIDAVFLIIGLLALLWKRSKVTLLLLAWALLAPLPASLAKESPHAARAMFMTGSWHLIIALGIYSSLKILRFKYLQAALAVSLVFAYGLFFRNYLDYYYNDYAGKSANEWQYGMKEIVQYVDKHPEYARVYMTDVRMQPYIFFLYYLKIPPDEFQKSVVYNEDKSRSYNLVYSIGRYQFGGWNEIESSADKGLMYIVEPSKYDGLRAKPLFDVNKLVKFPNKNAAFYIVSAPLF